MRFIFVIFFMDDLLDKYAKLISPKLFFQDWFQSYRVYCDLFLIIKSFSMPVFEICIILRDATIVQIYFTFNSKFSHIFKTNNLMCMFNAKFSDLNKPNLRQNSFNSWKNWKSTLSEK